VTAEQIAARYEFARPGFTLIGYEELALPVYRLRVRALLLERRRLEAIQEFVMRSLKVGLTSNQEVGRFLGLPAAVAKSAFSDLVLAEYIHLTALDESRVQRWTLTQKGRLALEAAEVCTPEEGEFEVDYDGLLRRSIPVNRFLHLPKEARAQGWIEVPAVPNRPPHSEELKPREVAEVLKAAFPGAPKRDLISIRSIERKTRYYAPAVALVYHGVAAGTTQVGIAVDGRVVPEYESAFARFELAEKLEMVAKADSPATPLTSEDVVAAPKQASDALRRAVSVADEQLALARERLNRAETQAARKEAELELQRADTELHDAIRRQAETGIRWVAVWEHPELLQRALAESQQRLLIISPWLNPVVVNRDFLSSLEGALRRGVNVYIGHGISQENERRNEERDRLARENLERLASRYPRFVLKRLGDTHAKVLAWDSACAVVSSFNWLSFKGDRLRSYRDEQGTAITIPSKVDEKFAEVLPRFSPPP
jgi:hypothetical protein